MRKVVMMTGLLLLIQATRAQDPILAIIKAGIKKVIVATDLKIQRIQNKTIWLQNAQKVLENKMSELKLTQIGDWVERQRSLYADYFDELWQVKNAIATFKRVKSITSQAGQLVKEYQKAFALLRRDKNFTAEEIAYMQRVYTGIIAEGVKSVEQVQLVITAFTTQMSDAKRLEVINEAAENITQHLTDLRQFSQENIRTSLQRSKEKNDVDVVKKLYGL